MRYPTACGPLILLVAFLILPSSAAAQSESLRFGDQTRVAKADGTQVQGRFIRWSGDSIALRTDAGEVTLPMATVREISTTSDPVSDGAKRGMKFGSVVGAIAFMSIKETRDSGALSGIFGAGAGALSGAFYGAIIDACVHRRRIVYSGGAASPAIMLAPTLTASRIGVTGVVRW